jgi:hypothetical protein
MFGTGIDCPEAMNALLSLQRYKNHSIHNTSSKYATHSSENRNTLTN